MFEEAVDVDRIQRRLTELGEIGETEEGGVTCLAYSEAENEAFAYLRGEIPDAYDVATDPMGNVFATPAPDAERSLYMGSHLDTVRNGGRFDGRMGVVMALEAIQAVDELDEEPSIAPTLAVFRAEETARFNVGLIGSRGALGLLEEKQLEATDEDGVSLREAMAALGFQPPEIGTTTIDTDRVAGFVEPHIEQGPILDAEDIPVGIVTEIRGILRDRVTVRGLPNHSGATPMEQRRDAVAGAAEMVDAVETIGTAASREGDLVATVGYIDVPDASANKVSGEATFPIDIRSVDTEYRSEIDERIRDRIRSIAKRRGLTVDIEVMERIDPVVLDERIGDTLAAAAEATGTDYLRMASGGGHDAMDFTKIGKPAGMVFTACDRGLSHNPNERVEPDAMAAGTRVLAQTLFEYRPE
jgi:hydantoinase/carbamoylase family amidase